MNIVAKATQTGVAVTLGEQLKSHFSLEVQQVGGSSATWTINLEGSLDGVTYTPIITHTDTSPGDAQIETLGAGRFPCRFRRINVVSLSLGTNQYLAVKLESIL